MGQFLITARTEEGAKSEKLAWSGFAGHRVGGQLADVHRGTELEVAGPVRVRAFGTCGPGRRPDRIALVIRVPAISRVAELVAVSMGSVFLPHPMHFVAPFFTQGMVQQGQIQDVGSLPRGRFSRPPYPKPARLPTCCPGVLSRASCSYFILAM